MKTFDKIKKYCIENSLIIPHDSVLVGLSGGADSVCLLRFLCDIRDEFDLKIYALHVHHGIRGAEADRDAEFCEKLCADLKVEFNLFKADVPKIAKIKNESLEEAGRNVRYAAFREYARDYGCTKIAVAHHLNDLAETFIFNLIRGSRLTGLTGISPQNGMTIRPLLCMTREEIEECLRHLKCDFVTDSTNLDTDYARNKIRNILIPEMKLINSESVGHIAETAEYLRQVNIYFLAETKRFMKDAVYIKEETEEKSAEIFGEKDETDKKNTRISAEIDIKKLCAADHVIGERAVYEAICMVAGQKKDITSDYAHDVMSLTQKQSGKMVSLKYNVTARRDYDKIVITKNLNPMPATDAAAGAQNTEDLKNVSKNKIDNIPLNCNNMFRFEIINDPDTEKFKKAKDMCMHTDGKISKYFDFDKITEKYKNEINFCGNFRPDMRYATDSDYITAYTDGRKKRVMDVLKDKKISADLRKKIPVFGIHGEVLLIAGIRGSEGYRITENTKNILYVSYTEE